MELRTDDLRVVDLADEFGITISETLALCKMFDIPAPYGSSMISPAGAKLLRGLASGEISPDDIDSVDGAVLAEARGPDYQPSNGPDGPDGPDGPVGPDGSGAGSPEASGAAAENTDDYDYGDPADYDSYGVAGLEDFPSNDQTDLNAPDSDSGVAEPRIAALHTPVPAETPEGADQSASETAAPKLPSATATGLPAASRPSRLTERGADRRGPDRRRASVAATEKREYDPHKLRAEYDDIDKYVPKWLKYVALAALAVFGFLAYQLVAGDSNDVVAGATQQTAQFSPGDCFNADIALWIDTVVPASCAGEHDGEIFDVFMFAGEPGAAYPDPAALTSQARQACRGTFAQYTGESSISSDLRIGVSLPSSIDWAKGDRLAYCSTISGDGTQLVGSSARS